MAAPRVISWVLTAKDNTAAAFNGFQRKLETLGVVGDRVNRGQAAMGAGMMVAGGMIFKGLDTAVDKALEFDTAFAAMNRQIGATGAEAEKWNDSFRKVYAGAPAATLDSVSAALGFLGQNLKGTRAEIENVAIVSHKLARINQEEVQPIVEGMGHALNNWGLAAGQASEKADVLTAVSQNTGVSITDLLNAAIKAGPAFRGLDITFDQTVSILGQLQKSGIDSSRGIQGLQKALSEAAKGTGYFKDAQGTLQERVSGAFNAIKNAATETEAYGIASQVFGSRSGAIFADAVRSGTFSLEGMTQALMSSGGALDKTIDGNGTLAGKVAAMKREMDLAKEAIGRGLTPVLYEIIKPVSAIVKAFGDFISEHPAAGKMVGIIGALAGALLLLGGGLIILNQMRMAMEGLKIIAGISKMLNLAFVGSPWMLAILALAGLAYLIITNWDTVKEWFGAFVDFMAGVWNTIYEAVAGAVESVINFVRENWQLLIAIILGPFGIILGLIIDNWNAIYGFISGVVSGIINFIREHWQLIIGIILGPFGIILALIITYWDQIIGAITAAINFIVQVFLTYWGIVISVVQFIWNTIVTIISTYLQVMWTIITTIVNAVVAVFSTGWNVLVGVVSAVWNAIIGVISDVWNFIVNVVTAGVTIVRQYVERGMNAVKNVWNSVWGGFKTTVVGVWNTIKDVVGKAWEFVKKVIDKLIEWVNKGIKKLGELVNKIPGSGIVKGVAGFLGLASGGPTTGGRAYMVGERGPELWMERSNGYMVPNNQLRSYAGGGVTDQSGLAMLHAREMVLPETLAQGLAALIAARGEGGRDAPLIGGDYIVQYPKPETEGQTLQRQHQKMAHLGLSG